MKQNIIVLLIAMTTLALMGCPNPITDTPPVPAVPSTITFADATPTRMIGSGLYTNTVSGVGTGAVTYTNENEATASVNVSTGAVTLKAAGTTEITITKAETATHTTATNSYTLTVIGGIVGDAYQGGKIAYILQSGDTGYNASVKHGIIAALVNQNKKNDSISGAINAYMSIDVPGAYGTEIGTGQANTNAIVAQNKAGTTYAAGLCDDYTNAETGTGVYSDWYLPSKDELNKLYLNEIVIGGFITDRYWSSSACLPTHIWIQNIGIANGSSNGSQSAYDKSYSAQVRAVRSF